jgi:hypothetical protein
MAMKEGDLYHSVTSDDFVQINMAANDLGLMAMVTAIEEADDGGPLVTFQLIRKDVVH